MVGERVQSGQREEEKKAKLSVASAKVIKQLSCR